MPKINQHYADKRDYRSSRMTAGVCHVIKFCPAPAESETAGRKHICVCVRVAVTGLGCDYNFLKEDSALGMQGMAIPCSLRGEWDR